MRIATVILSLAAVAVCLVIIRGMELSARHETMRLMEKREIQLRRKHWAQDIDLGYLTSWAEVVRRASEQGLEITDREKARYCLAAPLTEESAQGRQ